MEPEEYFTQFISKHRIARPAHHAHHADPGKEDAELLISIEDCEPHVAYIAQKLRNPKREHIERVITVGDLDHFTQFFCTQYEEIYIAGPEGIFPWAARVVTTPGYRSEFHSAMQNGAIQVHKHPALDEDISKAYADRYDQIIRHLETKGPEVLDPHIRCQGWKNTKTGEVITFARRFQGLPNEAALLEGIRIRSSEHLPREEMPQAFLDRHPGWGNEQRASSGQ